MSNALFIIIVVLIMFAIPGIKAIMKEVYKDEEREKNLKKQYFGLEEKNSDELYIADIGKAKEKWLEREKEEKHFLTTHPNVKKEMERNYQSLLSVKYLIEGDPKDVEWNAIQCLIALTAKTYLDHYEAFKTKDEYIIRNAIYKERPYFTLDLFVFCVQYIFEHNQNIAVLNYIITTDTIPISKENKKRALIILEKEGESIQNIDVKKEKSNQKIEQLDFFDIIKNESKSTITIPESIKKQVINNQRLYNVCTCGEPVFIDEMKCKKCNSINTNYDDTPKPENDEDICDYLDSLPPSQYYSPCECGRQVFSNELVCPNCGQENEYYDMSDEEYYDLLMNYDIEFINRKENEDGIMAYSDCDNIFYSIIGNHAGETPEEIVMRKQKEIEACGYSLWSAQIDKKSVEQVWGLKPGDEVVVLCKINRRVKDPVNITNMPYYAKQASGPNDDMISIPKDIKTSFTKGKNYQAYVVSKYIILDDEKMFDFSKYNSLLSNGTIKSFTQRFSEETRFQNRYGKKTEKTESAVCEKPIKVIMVLKYPFVVNLK